jgi:outer membrane protein OmpA-like peptidoglycan-associated protein
MKRSCALMAMPSFARPLMVLALAFLGWGPTLSAQQVLLQRAELLFEASAYAQAIPAYESFLERGAQRKVQQHPQAALHLAESLRLTGQRAAAAAWYGKVLGDPQADTSLPAAYSLFYAQTLLSLDQCEAALPWFEHFQRRRPADSRGLAGLASCRELDGMRKAPFELLNLSLNTQASEMGAFFVAGELWFSSSRRAFQAADSLPDKLSGRASREDLDPWSGEGYLSLYRSSDWQREEASAERLPYDLNSPYHDGPGTATADGRLLIWTRNRLEYKGKGLSREEQLGLGLAFAERQGEGEAWSAPQWLSMGSATSESEPGQGADLAGSALMHPALSPDGKELIFASDAPGGSGGFDLYRSAWTGNEWSAPEWLGPELNSPGDELYPHLDASGNLWFASDGRPGFGGLDLYIAHLRPSAQGWEAPALLAEPLNSRYDDFGLVWLRTDTLGVMVSNRPGGQGGDDLYEISRSWEAYLGDDLRLLHDSLAGLPQGEMVTVTGQAVRATTGESSGGGVARVTRPFPGDTVLLMAVDETGYFEGELPAGDSYLLEVDKPNFISEPVLLDMRNMRQGDALQVLAEVQEMKADLVVELRHIYYDYGKHHIRQDAEPELQRLLRLMQQYPDMRIELSSHTDSRSSSAYNLALSRKRAEAVRDWLETRGVDAGRIEAEGYGENRLRNHCSDEVPCSEEEHQFNRRTEFRILHFDAVVESSARQFAPGSVASPFDASASGSKSAAVPEAAPAQTAPTYAWGADDPANAWSRGTWHGVQLGIDRTGNSQRFAGYAWLGSIRVEDSGQGFYRYVIGYQPSRAEAEEILQAIRHAGIVDAFISTYSDGQRLR